MESKLKIANSENLSVLTVAQGCEPIVTFRPDGQIEVNPKFSVDEAAKAVWAAIDSSSPIRAAVEAEREACARVIGQIPCATPSGLQQSDTNPGQAYELGRHDGLYLAQQAIRARSTPKAESAKAD